MKLSKAQIKALLSATKKNDYMLFVAGPLKQALIDRKLIRPAQGYGYGFGTIHALTSRGFIERERILSSHRGDNVETAPQKR